MVEWRMTMAKADLVDAIGAARRRATLRRQGADWEQSIVIVAGDDGLSFRSSDAAMDIPASGTWPSPIRVAGAALRRLAPKLPGPDVALSYADGRLAIGATVLSATEV